MSNQRILSPYLFGTQITALNRYLKLRYNNVFLVPDSVNQTTKEVLTWKAKAPQIFFGTPAAAFRNNYQKFNGKIELPMINYYMTGYTRKTNMERPVVGPLVYPYYDPIKKTYPITQRDIRRFDVSFNFVVWTNTYTERDMFFDKLTMDFPANEGSLVYFPDQNEKSTYLFIHTKIEDPTDETEIEGLEEKETRDVIKTSFNLTCEAMLPYNFGEVGAIENIIVNTSTGLGDNKIETDSFGFIV